MVFSSESFLFLFLPVFMAVYYATPQRWRSYPILLGSYVFYAWWRIDFLGLLVLTTLFAYLMGQRVAAHRGSRQGRIYLTIGIGGCLLVLGVFKYLNFFVDSFAALWGTDAAGLGVHWRLILPIGISFYVFQAMSYLIDVHRGDARANARLIDFAAFIALFPQLIAGPILRYKDLEHQFEHRRHSAELFCDGMARFLVGLAKKVILADAIAPLVDLTFGASDPGFVVAWVGALAYMLQLYFDFSGYSDMAIGLGKMMGFRFGENFRFPYVSRSITEFWRRWHISLSSWLRDYLYVSLGGNRKGAARTYVNLLIVMLLGGLWHGANWTFVIWGLWHGGLLALERVTGWHQRAASYWLALPLTLMLVLLGWVMFRAEAVSDSLAIYAGMLGLNGFINDPLLFGAMSRESIALAGLAALVAAAEPKLWLIFSNAENKGPSGAVVSTRFPAASAPRAHASAALAHQNDGWTVTLATLVLGAYAVFRLTEQSFSPFLYFQF
ncbi:MBOAT family protein [Cognatishimia sp. SS12]|uniref:MBOAT family O-acyltransferase n=1 Tax=Cognatishimia sp. SS12 TaxID=2979465 RepID=UPI00232FFC61|nr:MBOAT family protein [Cognatishimia sp. SS12]MDC0738705.1 MBOAT family protein [Cognatishimia sp. SS12]